MSDSKLKEIQTIFKGEMDFSTMLSCQINALIKTLKKTHPNFETLYQLELFEEFRKNFPEKEVRDI
ncbi:hypothetical protein [Tenacibaculum piscium]|uniref:hypothetical protein n=1 Tax=Tenacibaculum piscium TaxID=1458515 RepID=UPI001F3DA406|nr:hypothetical protein [Tenacibaculum piscium]